MPRSDLQPLRVDDALNLVVGALNRCGASTEVARSVAQSIIAAEADGRSGVGLAHAVDYCESLLAGRVNARAVVKIERPAPVMLHGDADQGFPHPVFDQGFDALVNTARNNGMALFTCRNAYPCGELGYFVKSLARTDLVALAFTNAGPPAMAASGGTKAVFSTNPVAFAVPADPALVIDQSSSQTALVNLRLAREAGNDIPQGWALDRTGHPTTNPSAALEGVLLAFGGERGANIALMVEMLAAGITGANWSCDAPSFIEGHENPGTGLLIIALNPKPLLGPGFKSRFSDYLARLETEYDAYLPGRRCRSGHLAAEHLLDVDATAVDALAQIGADPL